VKKAVLLLVFLLSAYTYVLGESTESYFGSFDTPELDNIDYFNIYHKKATHKFGIDEWYLKLYYTSTCDYYAFLGGKIFEKEYEDAKGDIHSKFFFKNDFNLQHRLNINSADLDETDQSYGRLKINDSNWITRNSSGTSTINTSDYIVDDTEINTYKIDFYNKIYWSDFYFPVPDVYIPIYGTIETPDMKFGSSSNHKSGSYTLYRDFYKPSTPKIGTLKNDAVLFMIENLKDPADCSYTKIFFGNPYLDKNIPNLGVDFLTALDNINHLVYEESGIKGILINGEIYASDKDSETDDRSTFPGFETNIHESTFYTIRNIDNVHNVSDPLYIEICPDFTTPQSYVDKSKWEYDYSNLYDLSIQQFTLKIPYATSVEKDSTQGISIYDGSDGSGIDHSSLTFEIYENGQNLTEGLPQPVMKEGKLCFENYDTGNNYQVKIYVKDNVGNQSYDISGNPLPVVDFTFSVPTPPTIEEYSNSYGEWISGAQIDTTLDIQCSNQSEMLQGISRISLYTYDSNGIMYETPFQRFSREDLIENALPDNSKCTLTVRLRNSSWIKENIHSTFLLALKIETDSEAPPLWIEEIPMNELPNRYPSYTRTDDISLVIQSDIIGHIYTTIVNSRNIYPFNKLDSSNNESLKERIDRLSNPENGLTFHTYYQNFSESPTFLMDPQMFTDVDGDQCSLEMYKYPDEDSYYFYIKEYFNQEAEVYDEFYLLPIRVNLDNTLPTIGSISLSKGLISGTNVQNRKLEDNDSNKPDIVVNNVFDERGIHALKYRLTSNDISFTPLTKAQIFTNTEYIERNIQEWPFDISFYSLNAAEYTLTVVARDTTGNFSTEVSTNFVVDKQAPVLNLSEESFINEAHSTNEDHLIAHYSESGLVLELQSTFFDTQTDAASLTLSSPDSNIHFSNPELTNQQDDKTTLISLGKHYPPNSSLPIWVVTEDRAGNCSEPYNLTVSTPAVVTPELSPSGDFTNGYRVHFSFTPDTDNPPWKEVTLNRSRTDDLGSTTEELGSYSYAQRSSIEDTMLSPHGAYTYYFTAVNDSNHASQPVSKSVVIPNNPPEKPLFSTFGLERDGKLYFGANSPVAYSMDDADRDPLNIHVFIKASDGELSESLYSYDQPREYADYSDGKSQFNLSNILYPFEEKDSLGHLQTYQFQLSVNDGYPEGESPLSDLSPALYFDNSPPVFYNRDKEGDLPLGDIDFEERTWIWPEEKGPSFYGFKGISLTGEDTGVGMDHSSVRIILERENQADIEITPEATRSDIGDGDSWNYDFEFPQGRFHGRLYYADRLGNAYSTDLGTIAYDTSPPLLSSQGIRLLNSDHRKELDQLNASLLGSQTLKLQIDWSDNLSGLSAIECRLLNDQGTADYFTPSVTDPDQTSQQIYYTPRRGNLEEGTPYTLQVRLTDQGNNQTAWVSLQQKILFDLTAPQLSLEPRNWGLEMFPSKQYISNTSSFTLFLDESSYSDNVSAPEEIDLQYQLIKTTESDYEPLDGHWEPLDESTDLTFQQGEGYYSLFIRAMDEVSIWNQQSLSLIYDSQGPESLTANWDNLEADETVNPGRQLGLNISGQDRFTGIDRIEYRILDSLDNQVLSGNLPGNQNRHLILLPQDLINGDYSIDFEASDGAGNSSSFSHLLSFEIKKSSDFSYFQTPGCIGPGQNLTAQWEYSGEEDISSYKLTLKAINNQDGVESFEMGNITSNRFTVQADIMPNLNHYKTFYLQVLPLTLEKGLTPEYSQIIDIDVQPPEILSLQTPQMIQPDNFWVTWKARDNFELPAPVFILEEVSQDSGKIHYKAVEVAQKIPGLHSIDQEEEDSLARHYVSEHRVNLAPYLSSLSQYEKIRIQMLFTDAGGNVISRSSDLIHVANQDIKTYEIVDQGDYINPDENQTLEFSWSWASVDPATGEEGYSYQLSRNGSFSKDEKDWDFTTDRQAAFSFYSETETGGIEYSEGDLFQLLVKRVTLAGEETLMTSNGIVVESSAPELRSVTILNSDTGEEIPMVYTGDLSLQLAAEGFDKQSGIDHYTACPGDWEDQDFIPYGEDLHRGDFKIFGVTLPLGLARDDLVQYQVHAYNTMQMPSRPVYSKAIIYNPEKPQVSNILLSYNEEALSVSWEALSSVPLKEQELRLFRFEEGSGTGVEEEIELGTTPGDPLILKPGKRLCSIDNMEDLEDGYYQIEIKAISQSGGWGTGESVFFHLDRSNPEISSNLGSPYGYSNLSYSLDTNEFVKTVQLRIQGDRGLLLEETYCLDNPAKAYSDILDFTEKSFWTELAAAGNQTLKVILYAQDLADNWSAPSESELYFDSTRPSTPLVSRDNSMQWGGTIISFLYGQVGSSSTIDKVGLESTEDLSPITGYRWTRVNQLDQYIEENDWIEVTLENSTMNLQQQDLTLSGKVLMDNQVFYIAVQTCNQAGRYSETGYSEEMRADLSAPTFQMEAVEALKMEDSDPPVAVYQGVGRIELTLDTEQSPYLVGNFRIYDPQGFEIDMDLDKRIFGWDRSQGDTRLLDFSYDKDKPGLFRAELSLEDLFGHKSTHSLYFRDNRGPQFSIPQNVTLRPGEEKALPYQQWIQDSDGILTVSLEGPGLLETLIIDWGEPLKVPPLYQNSPTAQSSPYVYTLTAVDRLGTSSSSTLTLQVENSTQGTLLCDEYWSGIHYLTGPLIVPPGISLTIAESTEIIALSGPLYGWDQRIEIQEGASLIHLGSASYRSEYPGHRWQGILLEEDALFKEIIIENAERGITADQGVHLQIVECSFINNRIGLQLLSDQASIEDSLFQSNEFYGIKEEKVSDPLMRNNRFLNNGYDYYDWELSVMDADEIDELKKENSQNRKAGE